MRARGMPTTYEQWVLETRVRVHGSTETARSLVAFWKIESLQQLRVRQDAFQRE